MAVVRSAGAHFLVKAGDGVTGEVAYEGDIIDEAVLADGELERLRALHVFEEPQGRMLGPHDPTDEETERFEALVAPVRAGGRPPTVEDADELDALSDDELVEWMARRPPIAAVVRAVEDDPERARRVLRAESAATEGHPRVGLTRDLGRLLSGEEPDDLGA